MGEKMLKKTSLLCAYSYLNCNWQNVAFKRKMLKDAKNQVKVNVVFRTGTTQ